MTFYDTLGIPQTSSKDEIKQAYRRLAKKYHPDMTGGDDSKFKEINNAYSVLFDEQQRSNYDMSLNFSVFNNFNQHFTERNLNIERTIKIKLQDSYFGNKVTVEIYSNETVDINIPKGIRDGQKIKIDGMGTKSKTGNVYGDLIITIKIEPDLNVKNIDLLDLETTIEVNMFKLFGKFDIDITLWGTSLGKVKLEKDTDISKRIRIRGKGMTHTTFNSVGDLYVKLVPIIPNFDDLPDDLQASVNNYISQI